ncbi:hypothetical protein GCM10010399_37410 [Dactylosporangium fulvum]|uniref:Uncharacterized protein n=1 Tax=Dactylosporangium fulvum TaxID=53359 RepID=A0ABY5VT82_9ACTN|nr:hypothetical protein [Dactylosporangium fulvum]UWP80962.1 hypothetical protein Dfulv_38440 [Dactylosporangium fulvum]
MAASGKRLGTDRLLVDAYSASSQRMNAAAGYLHERYVGQLRLDLLLSRTLVIPDTHFLDGRFFIDIAPPQLSDLVGRGVHNRILPIEVRTRGHGAPRRRFAAALRTFLLRGDGAGTLNGFTFNAVGADADRSHLASALGQTPEQMLSACLAGSDDAEVPDRLARFLTDRAPTTAHDDIDRLAEGWRRWIEAERGGLLTTAAWGDGFDLATALLHYRPLPPDTLTTGVGRSTYDSVVQMVQLSRHRSDLTALLEKVRSDRPGLSVDEAIDLETIDRWYSAGRHVALARQHGIRAIASSFQPGRTPTSYTEQATRRLAAEGIGTDLVVPDDLMSGLVAMEGSEFGRFSYEHDEALARLWAGGGPDEARRVVDPLLRAIEPANRHQGTLLTGLGVAAGASAAATAPISAIVSAGLGGLAGIAALPAVWEAWRRRSVVSRVIEFLTDRTSSTSSRA